ncbi:dihydroorotate dehydrogenase (fumarate) [Propionibacterium cyclohexanicum]|uniref:Dihydroorotate dehydrogenase (Fumarate) n=1 Tax=Propionibacterium cyclohexanicum TaxID=64702 RepID=A0A1H9QGD6_9ACTN|nr:dihydroorotate dehydrogenase-like protein [Propionibacterium cyclohexanicum]SER59596.1 dihydroorotate dehydrogenase (fumarate) [Propionibacterium cyclohexanicum]
MSANPDLSTSYLGLQLSGPIIASSNPLNRTIEGLKSLEAAGASAVVLPSLFAEEVEAEELETAMVLETGDEFAEFASAPLAEVEQLNTGADAHLRLVAEAKKALGIPVIASVNGSQPGDWARYAAQLVEAGADAMELNLYDLPVEPGRSPEDVEVGYLRVIASVKRVIGERQLAVKISEFLSSLPHFAVRARNAGADALVLFNRFYGPDLDLDSLSVVPTLALSTSAELPMRLRWVGILSAQQPELEFAVTGGVHTGEDVVKSLIVGGQVAYTASALLDGGAGALTSMLAELKGWLVEHDYESVDELRGAMDASSVDDPHAFERAQYMKVLNSWA